MWKMAPAIIPRNRNIAEPIISPVSLLILATLMGNIIKMKHLCGKINIE